MVEQLKSPSKKAMELGSACMLQPMFSSVFPSDRDQQKGKDGQHVTLGSLAWEVWLD